MEWCGVFMMGLWASGLRSLRPLASTHSVPRLTTPSFSPHINPFRKNSKLKQNILWFGLSFVQISCRKIRSFPFLIDFHSFLPKRARKYHLYQNCETPIHVDWWKICHTIHISNMIRQMRDNIDDMSRKVIPSGTTSSDSDPQNLTLRRT